MSTTADQQTGEAVLDSVVERFGLKSLVEACLLVEEGVAQIKDIDMGMMMGAGIIPGPFAAADERGLDEILDALENAPDAWGPWFDPPLLLRRMVAQGRLGKKTGQGFYPYIGEGAETNLGIIPGFGGTQRLPRLVGEAKALELNLTGDPIDAWEAQRIGLANEVVPDHELFDTALAWARKLADQAPIAIEQIKRVSANGDLDAGLQAEAQGFATA